MSGDFSQKKREQKFLFWGTDKMIDGMKNVDLLN